MTPARVRLLLLILAPVLAVCWFVWWSGASVQADRTFTRLKLAIEQGRAGAVLDNLHSGYDIKGSWPDRLGGDGADLVNDSALRLLTLRGLTVLFQLQQSDPFIFRYTITSVEPQPDATVVVTVTIDLSTTSGHRPLTFTPPLTNQRFILAQESWWPALYVKAHPALSVHY